MTEVPLKWHGGKAYLASRIIALMPPHLHYCEPYCGGCAVLLARDPEGVSEVVNDINGRLTRFWNVLAHNKHFPEFLRRVQATPFSEERWGWAKLNEKLSPPENDDEWISEAVDFFILCRQSLAGRMQSFATLSRRRTRRGMNEQASAWLTCVDGLPAVHERLKRVVILNRDALDVIRQQDGENTLHYVDPPYLHSTRSTTKEYGEHEMSEQQHRELLALLRVVKGKVILSGYPSELYDTEIAGWRRETHNLPNNAAGGASKARETEVLWCNY